MGRVGLVVGTVWKNNMFGMHDLIPVTIASAFVFGMMLAILGSAKSQLAKGLGLDETQADGLVAAFTVALLPMMLLAGILADQVGIKAVLILGSILTALGIFCLTRTQSFSGCLYAVFLAAGGGACLSASAVVLMPQAFFANNAPASMNLGFLFIGLGALLTPPLVAVLSPRLQLQKLLGCFALICLTVAVTAIFTSSEVFPRTEADIRSVLTSPLLWIASLVFLLYNPLEGALGAWVGGYLKESGLEEKRLARLLAGFWLSFLAGRLLLAYLFQGILAAGAEAWILVILALLAAMTLGNLAGTHRRFSAVLGLMLLGAFLGPIFPTLAALVAAEFASAKGTAFGAMFALGGGGSLFLPPALASYARQTSVRAALRLPALMALLLAGAALLLALVHLS